MDFTFLFPGELIVKRGALNGIGPLATKHMKKACVFHFGKSFYTAELDKRTAGALGAAGVGCVFFDGYEKEPSPETVNKAAAFMRDNGCDGAVAIGGGSAIDTAKAACALAPNGQDIMDYVEGFGKGKFTSPPLPCVALPTTAGTGSECTKNSVITSKGNFKNSVRDDKMVPVAAVIDAELMVDVPREATMQAGMDCICHLVECYATRHANLLSDAITLHFCGVAFPALEKVAADLNDVRAREKMGVAASAAGLAMTNAGLGMAHGLAAGMGALTSLPHGLVCGILLPHTMRFNMERGVLKYADIARTVTGELLGGDVEAAEAAVKLVEALNKKTGLPADFKDMGITKADAAKIAQASMGSSMSKNPVEVSLQDCEALMLSLI